MEDFLVKKVFEVLHNIYTEKNASDLMNEESTLTKIHSEGKNKRKNKKSKKKVKSGENLDKKEESSPKSSDNSDESKVTNENQNGVTNVDEFSLYKSESKTSLTKNILSQEDVLLPVENIKEKKTITKAASDYNLSNVNQQTNSKPIENRKMSWRKMPPLSPRDSSVSSNFSKSKNNKPTNDDQQLSSPNTDELYVNSLVKSLLSKIINKDSEDSQQSKPEVIIPQSSSNIKNTPHANKRNSPFNNSSSNYYQSNKTTKDIKDLKNAKMNKHRQLKVQTPNKVPSYTNNKKTVLKTKDYLQKENEEIGNEEKVANKKSTIQNEQPKLEDYPTTATANATAKTYSSDNEIVDCKIESINHKIIHTIESKKKMVDNFSQTEKGVKTVSSQQSADTETVHSTTHDEEEKPIEVKETPSKLSQLFSEKPKKRKKNLYINNFKSEKVDKAKLVKPNQNNTNKINTNPINALNANNSNNLNVPNFKPKSKQGECHLDLKKCISEGYQFKEEKSDQVNSPYSSNNNSSFTNKPKPLNNNYMQSTTSSNPRKSKESLNWDLDDFTDMSEDTYSYKSKWGNKSYYGGGGSYNKRGKFINSNWNYGNKFNSESNYLTSKQVNNRALFSRGDYYPNNNPYCTPFTPPVYNNYYIFNSNVNINNVNNNDTNLGTSLPNAGSIIGPNPPVGNMPINQITTPPIPNNNFANNNMYYNQYNYGMSEMNYLYPSMLIPGNNSQTEEPSKEILDKIEGDIHPFIFHYRLHNDILEYSNSVTALITSLKDIKLYIINYLEQIIKSALGQEVVIDLYGSFATDLSIESSDIDITIKFIDEAREVHIEELIEKLCDNFKSLQVMESINPILTASVPVIKLLIDPEKVLDEERMTIWNNFKQTDIFNNYTFDREELLKVKVDLSFIELTGNRHSSQSTKSSLDWAKKTLNLYPEIKPIIHVLKRYMQIKKLNSSFNGGLSSFSVFLLIVAYLKYPKIKTKINLGRILMEVFELYGKFFQYAQSIIDVNLVSPFIFTNDFLENFPVILDPVTGLNVAKTSFRIEEVRESFSHAYDFLNRQKINFDKKDLPSTANVVFDLMLKSNSSCKFI